MKNKCGTCGYRFKSNEEVICPECLTARDTDVNCENFHTHEDNVTFMKSGNTQNNAPNSYYGYVRTDAPKKSGKGCLIVFLVLVGIIVAVTALSFIFSQHFDETESTHVTASYGDVLTIQKLQVAYSKPYEVECPDKIPLREDYKLMAVDVAIANSRTDSDNYSYFSTYNAKLHDANAFAEDYDSYNTWSSVSFNGVFENQAPDNIHVYPGVELNYTIYYEIPKEIDDIYLTATTSEYFDDKYCETVYELYY